VANLIQPVQEKHVMQLGVSNSEASLHAQLAAAFPNLTFQDLSRGLIRVESGGPVHVGPLVRFLEDQGAEVIEARRIQPSLEDVFVQITGIEAEAMCKEKEKRGGGI
jgi:ABC-2 type transport system ATP-binding protein